MCKLISDSLLLEICLLFAENQKVMDLFGWKLIQKRFGLWLNLLTILVYLFDRLCFWKKTMNWVVLNLLEPLNPRQNIGWESWLDYTCIGFKMFSKWSLSWVWLQMLLLIQARKFWSRVHILQVKVWDVMLLFSIWTRDHWSLQKWMFLFWQELQRTENFRGWVPFDSSKLSISNLLCWVTTVCGWMPSLWMMLSKWKKMKKTLLNQKRKKRKKQCNRDASLQKPEAQGMTSTLTPDLQGISSIQLNLLQGMSSILKENIRWNSPRSMLLIQALWMWMKSEPGRQILKGNRLKLCWMKWQMSLCRFCLNRNFGGDLCLCLFWVWIKALSELLEWLLLCRDIEFTWSSTRFIVAFEITSLPWVEQWEEYFSRRSCIHLTFLDWITNLSAQVFISIRKEPCLNYFSNLKLFRVLYGLNSEKELPLILERHVWSMTVFCGTVWQNWILSKTKVLWWSLLDGSVGINAATNFCLNFILWRCFWNMNLETIFVLWMRLKNPQMAWRPLFSETKPSQNPKNESRMMKIF